MNDPKRKSQHDTNGRPLTKQLMNKIPAAEDKTSPATATPGLDHSINLY